MLKKTDSESVKQACQCGGLRRELTPVLSPDGVSPCLAPVVGFYPVPHLAEVGRGAHCSKREERAEEAEGQAGQDSGRCRKSGS